MWANIRKHSSTLSGVRFDNTALPKNTNINTFDLVLHIACLMQNPSSLCEMPLKR